MKPGDQGLTLDLLQELKDDLTGTAPIPRSITQDSEREPNFPDCEAKTHDPTPSIRNEAPPTSTIAGLTHSLDIDNAYYKATIPIWLDEIASTPTAVETWKGDFLSEEASEVVRAIGAWIVIVPLGQTGQQQQNQEGVDKGNQSMMDNTKQLLYAVKEVIDGAYGGDGIWEGVLLALGVRSGIVGTSRDGCNVTEEAGVDDWDDMCIDHGFEFVDVGVPGACKESVQDGRGAEKTGLARVKEALEANEWESGLGDAAIDEMEVELGLVESDDRHRRDHESRGFENERQEMEREFAGLKMAMNTNDDETFTDFEEDQANGVEELEKMMFKMQAVKDMSAHLPEIERKRLAAKTIREIMGSM